MTLHSTQPLDAALGDGASSLLRRFGVPKAVSAPIISNLLAAYQEPQRRYHTLQHIDECLSLLSQCIGACQHPDEVALAIWYHDVVYKPGAKDNEERSAARACAELLALRLKPESVDRISAMVLATKHHKANSAQNPDEQVLIDIDLAVLGAEPERFAEYSRQIRAEYAYVPWKEYVSVRRKVLQHFAQLTPLMHTLPLAHRNAIATRNLSRATSFPRWLFS
jgi:predicted metal-dependent HD superfamily phosphohydrolase